MRRAPLHHLLLLLAASLAILAAGPHPERAIANEFAIAGLAASAPGSTAPSGRVVYALPVPGKIVDPYRPPTHRYGPGNNGVDLTTTPGAPVGAAAAGVVQFAGQVGGRLFVVIMHADGVRTTLGFLASVSVRVGQQMRAGQIVGTSGTTIHFGARRGDVYIDPLSLLDVGPPSVWLVPAA